MTSLLNVPSAEGYLNDDERAWHGAPPSAVCGGPVTVGWTNHRKMTDTQD